MSNIELVCMKVLIKLKCKASCHVSDRDQISDKLSKENTTDDGIKFDIIKFAHMETHYNAKT